MKRDKRHSEVPRHGPGSYPARRHPVRQRLFPILLTILMLLVSIPTPANASAQPQTSEPQQEAGLNDTDVVGETVVAANSGGEIQASGLLPSATFDPDEIGWASIRGLSSAAFSTHFNQMKGDYMMVDIEVDEIAGAQRVSAVWQLNTGNLDWAEWRNLNSSQFHDKWTELKQAGYRLIDQESYMLNGDRFYAGVWVENRENLGWASLRNLTSAEFSENFSTYSDAGYVIIDVEAYPTTDGLRYAMVWVENKENLDWREHRNLTSAEFSEKFEAYRDKYRMWDVESYRHNGVQYYAGIWVENKNGRKWAELRDMTATDYRNRWYRMRDLGYRLIDFEVYPTANGERYAGIWRQNSDRPDWPVRSSIDDLVQTYLETYDVPGIGVAIAQDGEIKYMRGFGYQDVDNGVWYSARSINRLASVSKAVGGVLAMYLVEQGLIDDLDTQTADVIRSLPDHHTHTLRQLLSNRSGIGHYGDYSVPVQQYDSALAAAQTFWNTDSDPGTAGTQLVYEPGVGCKYSTHAYTVFGAALEALAGKPVGQIVNDELTEPFGLNTVRQEQPGDGDGNRSVAYDDSNNAQPWGNASWKLFGGGLESSSYDLVRFLMKVTDGSIISPDGLTELRTVPEPFPCINSNGDLAAYQYALGWDVGTKYNTPVIWKGGNWNPGANTHVRIYPELDTAIVVLANRNGGHNTRTLGAQISDLMFADLGDEDGNGYDVNGVQHDVAGNAHASYDRDGRLMVTRMDDGGDDGVDSMLADAKFWGSRLQILLEPGRSMFGAAAIAKNGDIASTLKVVAARGSAQIQASFDEPTYQVQYVMDDTIVHVGDEGGGNAPAASINWDLFWCAANLPHDVPSQLCDVYVSFYENQQGACEWNLRFPAAMSIDGPNGEPIAFNRLRLVESEDAHVGAAAVQDEMLFSAIQLRGSNMELFSVDEVSSGGVDIVPPMPQGTSSETRIYLPLLSNQ